MHHSISSLPEAARAVITASLNRTLTDGIDLFTQIKVAHWNIKGAHFAALHPLFDTFAGELAAFNDEIAERTLTLGGLAVGTARHVAKSSTLADYPQDVTEDLKHVKLLNERIAAYLLTARGSRTVADEASDGDTVDLLTTVISTFEKHAWFLQATLGG